MGKRCARPDRGRPGNPHTYAGKRHSVSYGIKNKEAFPRSKFFNHEWNRQETFRRIGSLPAKEVEKISNGLLREEVPVDINKKIFDYDLILIAGPVFPHEVVGYSGGAKYLFPGISGGDFLHFFHWLARSSRAKESSGLKTLRCAGSSIGPGKKYRCLFIVWPWL
jgi:nickel-dependent lactate racemase